MLILSITCAGIKPPQPHPLTLNRYCTISLLLKNSGQVSHSTKNASYSAFIWNNQKKMAGTDVMQKTENPIINKVFNYFQAIFIMPSQNSNQHEAN
jgi:hypothetical protein